MRWRLILGPLLAAVLGGLLAIDAFSGRAAWGLMALGILICTRATWELTQLFRIRSFSVQHWLVQICSLTVYLTNFVERISNLEADLYVRQAAALGSTMLAFSLALMLLLWSEAVRYRRPGQSMESLGAEIFIVSYVGVLLSMTAQLRWVAGNQWGTIALGSLIVTAKFGDIFAYFLGKFFGRRKLIVHLSPGKTWMGACGAILGAILGALLWFRIISPLIYPGAAGANIWCVVTFGAAIGLVGLLGDLCESLIKRDTEQKDSARLIPEFGGILDLVDSVIYAAPAAYLLWLVLPFWTSLR